MPLTAIQARTAETCMQKGIHRQAVQAARREITPSRDAVDRMLYQKPDPGTPLRGMARALGWLTANRNRRVGKPASAAPS